jgi:hypothetical protein
MPMKSKAQNAAMHAAKEGKSTLGIPPSVGRKFVAESQGQKIAALPQRKQPAPPQRDRHSTPAGRIKHS